MLKQIIEPTEISKKEFIALAQKDGGGSNASTIVITNEEYASLSEGKIIAIDDGEYTTYLKLENQAESN